jgi:hypothetical protein
VTLSVSLPPGATCDRAILAAGFEALHEANHARLPCTLAIERREGRTAFLITCPPELRAFLEAQIYAAAPAARIETEERNTPDAGAEHSVLLFLKPSLSPHRNAEGNGTSDPLRMLLAVLDRLPPGARAALTLTIRPTARRERSRDAAVARKSHRLSAAFSPEFARWYLLRRARAGLPARLLVDAAAIALARLALRRPRRNPAGGGDLIEAPLFSSEVALTLSGEGADSADRVLAELAGACSLLGFGAVLGTGRVRRNRWRRRAQRSGLMRPHELADFWHLPTADAETAGIAPSPNRELEAPAWLPTPEERPDLTVLGESVFRNRVRVCGLLPDDRLRHLVVLGKTGTGKSTLLEQLIQSDIARGHAVGVIDPHGQLVESIADRVPRRRTNDVVLFDAADTAYPVGFDPLRCRRREDRPLVASGVLAAFKKLYPDFFGPRMEHVFRNALLACVAVPGLTLVDLQRLLCDPTFRRRIVDRCDDAIVRQFWLTEFAAMPQKLQAEAVAPVQNKVGAFVSHPVLRNIVGQADARLDLRRVMDEGKVLLCSVSKGRIGDDASALLGSLLITSLQLAAMSRADMPEADRKPFFLTVDEFGSFATDAFASILAESRKYRLGLTAAMQYLAQATPATLAALFGNAGSLLAFQCGSGDASVLAEQLGPPVTAYDLLRVPRFQAYARLLHDGRPAGPFTIRTIRPVTGECNADRLETIRRSSRRQYARPIHSAIGTLPRVATPRHIRA